MNNSFNSFFARATNGAEPYPYQERLATRAEMPHLLSVPTGVGKTAAAVLSWLYRRRFASAEIRQSTPRRLVYCLPMRTLVEQTHDATSTWLQNMELADVDNGGVGLHLLMGGADDGRWYEHPERDAILIGTQDMLLSRALNRGYGMSQYAWPVQFALLNNDCQWVLDETQLMGVGLTTSAQLAGLRKKLQTFGNCWTMWMSATLDVATLATVDHPLPDSREWTAESIQRNDREQVAHLLTVAKPCQQANISLTPDTKKTYATTIAQNIVQSHANATLTLVVVNRVARAQDVFKSLRKQLHSQDDAPELQLIHSRFRAHDRNVMQAAALDETTIPSSGRIIVATQAIEAGVDISATTLFTELAPWSSLVQRFGRCNRRGKCGCDGQPAAQIYWIDIDTTDPKKAIEPALPYAPEAFVRARKCLAGMQDVGFESLEVVRSDEPDAIPHVIRRKDLLDLFDTTPDLSGNDLDVSRYIRDNHDTDVQVYWRDWDVKDKQLKGLPPDPAVKSDNVEFAAPVRDELCSVSVAALRGKTGFIKKAADKDWRCYAWNSLDRQWNVVRPDAVRPGMMLLFHANAGGYDADIGWTGDAKHSPVSDCRPDDGQLPDAMDDEYPVGNAIEIAQHLQDVGGAADELCQSLNGLYGTVPLDEVVRAAWWHDVGKAHAAFQGAIHAASERLNSSKLWAKSGTHGYLNYQIPLDGEDRAQRRRGFRHELASALAWLQQHEAEPHTNLIAYLIAAHHGKVRMSLRSMPNENRPPDADRLFARGIWDGDELPQIDIGNSERDVSGPIRLSLDMMQLGEHNGRPSWLARTLALRDEFGPFKLAYLEMLVRVADSRGTQAGVLK